jgi:transposase-like protein
MNDPKKLVDDPGSPERSGGERSEPTRSAGEPGRAREQASATEVDAVPRRRAFSNAYKLRIVREADACRKPGDVGALLRREGLYSSLLVTWRRLRDAGSLLDAQPRRRGPKAKPVNPLQGEVDRLRRANTRLETELEQARAIIDVQKKVAALFATLPKAGPRDGANS